MAARIQALDTGEVAILEEGVAWAFGPGPAEFPAFGNFHRMIVSAAGGGRFLVSDERDTLGYCCDHCNGPLDDAPQAVLNGVATRTGWLRDRDVIGLGGRQWRVVLRRGPLSPLGDLFRIAPPPKPARFGELLAALDGDPGPATFAGLLRFAHFEPHHGELVRAARRVLPYVLEAPPAVRTAGAALLVGLVRAGAARGAAEGPLARFAADESLEPWIRMSALSVLALGEAPDPRHASGLRRLVTAALVEGDAPAAVARACETLARVLEDEPLRELADRARAALSDAAARRRRALAVTMLAAFAERDPESARAVLRGAADPHQGVRVAAVRALVRLPPLHAGAADAALLELLGDADDEVFEAAWTALFGGSPPRLAPEVLLAEVDRAAGDPPRLARLTQALDRLGT